jgi:isoquinoline 1-oxidoreductase beta subunit
LPLRQLSTNTQSHSCGRKNCAWRTIVKDPVNLSRRSFLRLGLACTSSLLLQTVLSSPVQAVEAGKQPGFSPSVFLHIDATNKITIFINKVEMGQGITTSLAMLIAEELEADWSTISVAPAPLLPAFDYQTKESSTATLGSSSISKEWERLRRLGATARLMLIEAAARIWQVEPETCSAENSEVIHQPTGQRLTYGDLVESAGTLPVPDHVPLKNSADFRIIGTGRPDFAAREKYLGKAIFGIDISIQKMLVARIARPPFFGASCIRYDDSDAKAIPGVKEVLAIDSGVAVLADGYYSASRAVNALQIEWDDGPLASLDTDQLTEKWQQLAQENGISAVQRGEAQQVLRTATRTLKASYLLPYLAHAPMEPLCCLADVHADSCEIWTGTQLPTFDRDAAAALTGLPPEKVQLHAMLCGGSFGRRAAVDNHFVKEAVQLSKTVKAPVKVYWSREDDLLGGYYRPGSYHQLRGALGDDDLPLAWHHRVVGQLLPAPLKAPAEEGDKADDRLVAGADSGYQITHFSIDYHPVDDGIPVLCWRGGAHVATAYARECFVDELARAAGYDPYYYRRLLLTKKSREKGVLELAARQAGWGQDLPKGRARGIAVHSFHGSSVAQVAEVSLYRNGSVKVHRVTCAVDCGQVVHPDTVAAQLESAVVFALTAILYGEISCKEGRVQQSSFRDYPLLGISEMPEIDVHFVPSSAAPGGIGELGVPPLAPAVANAIFALTGQPMRVLPLSRARIRTAMGLAPQET